jgi:hypothetical protein
MRDDRFPPDPTPRPLPARALRTTRAGPRAGSAAAAAAAAALLAACGGGSAPASDPQLDAPTGQEAGSDAAGRDFLLWAPGAEARMQAEQMALEPDGNGQTVRLLVRLNPAAVPADARAAIAGAAGNGETGSSEAARAQQLASKATAVATAAAGVFARSVRGLAPQARIQGQFSHAVEGFVLVVPWDRAQAVASELARDAAVDAVEVDRPMSTGQSAAVRMVDPRAWGVDRIDQRARPLDGAFRQPLTGAGVSVYVIDTGIAPHREFGSRLRAGFTSVGDGKGTVDCNGHGTHVAGTAAGATLGVAPAAALVPVRVLDCNGSGFSSSVIAGLDWVAAHGTRPGVVNMSLGGPGSTTLDAAVQRLVGAGLAVVAAAGNENVDACARSPARAPGVVAVAASDGGDAKAPFSNWGGCVALWAPGTAIGSAGIAGDGAVVAMNGTSMAAPHAAGAAALLLQERTGLAPAQVLGQLQAQATPEAVAAVPSGTTRRLLYAGTAAPVPAPPLARLAVGSLALGTQVPQAGLWVATASIRVVDTQGRPVAGAAVAGRFSHMVTATGCTTAADGTCRIAGAPVPWATVTRVGFAVVELKASGTVDGGSGARSAQIDRPAAPQASVAALSGAMTPTAPGASTWRPSFTVRLADERGAAVPGAVVTALLTAHAGAQAVAMQPAGCVAGARGDCMLGWGGAALGTMHTGARVQIIGVSGNFLVYRPGPGALVAASVGRTQ